MKEYLEQLAWRKPAMVSVFAIAMLANLDATHRYVSRWQQGPLLWVLCVGAALLPLLWMLPTDWHKRLWKGTALASVVVAVVVWVVVPVETVRVDRWELMSNFLDRLFRGDYPYLASSRYNVAPPAPFPGLYLVGLPAWWIGEIGWFPLLSLAFLVWRTPKPVRPTLVVVLATSLPVWYEVIVRSNIVANAGLVGAFLLTEPGRKSVALVGSAVVAGVLLCTRASFAAPILAWTGSVFVRVGAWRRLATWGSVAGFVAVLPFLLLVAVWGWPLFYDWNPLRIQGAIQSPVGPLLVLAASPWIGSLAATTRDRLWTAYLVALLPMLALLLPPVADGSWMQPNRGYFEVAFWNAALVLGLLAWAWDRSTRSD